MAQPSDLHEAGAEGEEQAGKNQKHHKRGAPDNIIYRFYNFGKHVSKLRIVAEKN